MSFTRRVFCLSTLGLLVTPALAGSSPKSLISMRGRIGGVPVRGFLYELGQDNLYRFVLSSQHRARYIDFRPRPADLSRHVLLTQPGRYHFSGAGGAAEMLVTEDRTFHLRPAGGGESGPETTVTFASSVLWAIGGLAFAGLGLAGLAALVYMETGKTPTEAVETITGAITDAIESGDVPATSGEG